MFIQLDTAAAEAGSSFNFSGSLNFGFADLGRGQRFVTPVAVSGVIKNRAGILTLDYTADFTLHLGCDRCLKMFDRAFSFRFDHTLALLPPEDEESEVLVCEGGRLDMQATAVDDVFSSLPSQALCTPDCRGLCPVCGADLGETDCEHVQQKGESKNGDPRWAALKNLKLGDEN